MSNNFRVGQKVVCITGDGWILYGNGGFPGPKKDEICLITGLWQHQSHIGLYLEGYGCKYTYDSAGFRPAVERGTDTGMAILTKLLLDNMVDA